VVADASPAKKDGKASHKASRTVEPRSTKTASAASRPPANVRVAQR
jgi:hypothetical protein